MAVYQISENDFEEKVINNCKPVLVDFYATWCGPCAMQAPVIESLSERHSEYDFYKVDVDKAMNLAQQYGVKSIPTLISFKNGEQKKTEVGVQSENAILNMLNI